MIDAQGLKGKLMDDRRAKEQAAKKSQNTQMWLKLKQGVNYLMIAPPHPNMGGIPFVVRRVHFGLGPDKNLTATCLRDNETEPIENCEACKDSYNYYKKGLKNEASRIRVKSRKIIQVIDFTDFVNNEGLEAELPECFMDYQEGNSKCQKCPAVVPCKTKFQVFTLPISVSEEIMGDFEDLLQTNDLETLEQIFDMRHGYLYKIKKTGEEIETRYTNIKRVKSNIKMSKSSYAKAKLALHDLTTLLTKLSPEDMRTLMDEGVILTSEDSEEIPKCFGDIDSFDEKKCKKCDYIEVCIEEIEHNKGEKRSLPDEEEEEEEEEEITRKAPVAKKVRDDEEDEEEEEEIIEKPKKKPIVVEEDDDEEEEEKPVKKVINDSDDDEESEIDLLREKLARIQEAKKRRK